MPTITDYLDQLDVDKATLYSALNTAGVEVESTETFTTLTPKTETLVNSTITLVDDINGEEV